MLLVPKNISFIFSIEKISNGGLNSFLKYISYFNNVYKLSLGLFGMTNYVCSYCKDSIIEGKVRTGIVDGERVYLHTFRGFGLGCGAGSDCSVSYRGNLKDSREVNFSQLDSFSK